MFGWPGSSRRRAPGTSDRPDAPEARLRLEPGHPDSGTSLIRAIRHRAPRSPQTGPAGRRHRLKPRTRPRSPGPGDPPEAGAGRLCRATGSPSPRASTGSLRRRSARLRACVRPAPRPWGTRSRSPRHYPGALRSGEAGGRDPQANCAPRRREEKTDFPRRPWLGRGGFAQSADPSDGPRSGSPSSRMMER